MTKILRSAQYRSATTAIAVSHNYTMKNWWDSPEAFVDCSAFIRENGYSKVFAKRKYTYFDIDGHHYWDSGGPLKTNAVINRAMKTYEPTKEFTAPDFEAVLSVSEKLQGSDLGRVLEVGLPDSGPLLHSVEISPRSYTCLDTRQLSVTQAQAAHPQYEECFQRSCLSDHYGGGYDTIVAMWGSASHIPLCAIERIPFMLAEGGSAVLMFRGDGRVLRRDGDREFRGFVVRRVYP